MASTNILKLILNIAKYQNNDLSRIKTISKLNPASINRANSMGEALEYYVKDALCDTFTVQKGLEKARIYS